ncbi:Arylsulfatase [Anaerohalosphaera lusitana]|uniref:Arylsulfatase n=1 Tax=Anaerohalosphaera lusitana TaxID=1936003 RepID=A0A1U9NKC6_9BACT|nr:sulfatase [Anaerohalosphaera lusitana]AQT68382.1 Arylsulfatase [Anaerohalosphaera lusitana]
MRLDRRSFLKLSGFAAAAALSSPSSVFSAVNTKPNLLIIHTDEHNFRTLGCYRKTLSQKQAFVWGKNVAVETPHIDSLAENGTLCTSFYATTPVCSPSRSSFVSGRYPQNTPVVTNNIRMNDDIETFAATLQKHGYKTGYAGKWHLDGFGKPQWGPEREFGFADNRYMFNRGHWKLLEDTPEGPRVAARNNKGRPSYSVANATPENFTTDFLADKAIEFVTANRNEPFCYMVSIPDPHGPNSVRPPYETMYQDLDFQPPETSKKSAEGLPSWGKKARPIGPRGMAKYFGMVKCIDDNVGKMVDHLKKLDLLDNTIVVFTSDHGDLCGEHSRNNKGVPYEASAKIPFVISWPKKIKKGNVINHAMSCVDFLPTVLSLMDVPTSGKEDGRDASGLFTGTDGSYKDIAFIRGTGDRNGTEKGDDKDNWFGVVTSRYKLIYAPEDKPWLFDLKKDPDELVNFYEEPAYKDTRKELAKELIAYAKKHNDPRITVATTKKYLAEAIA